MNVSFAPGDLVIYRKTKHSRQPGPRAANIQPAQRGETYTYTVDKYWIVDDVTADGTVVVSTRRGKKNHIRHDDPMLQRANWFQRLLYRSKFPAPEEDLSMPNAQAS